MGYLVKIDIKEAEKDGLKVEKEKEVVFAGYEDEYACEGPIYRESHIASLNGLAFFADPDFKEGYLRCSYGGTLIHEIREKIPDKYIKVVD